MIEWFYSSASNYFVGRHKLFWAHRHRKHVSTYSWSGRWKLFGMNKSVLSSLRCVIYEFEHCKFPRNFSPLLSKVFIVTISIRNPHRSSRCLDYTLKCLEKFSIYFYLPSQTFSYNMWNLNYWCDLTWPSTERLKVRKKVNQNVRNPIGVDKRKMQSQ